VPLRDALARVQPYRPARPMRELQAELGLPRIVKLSSNEGAALGRVHGRLHH
jgi:hypothetical protein